MTKLFILSLLLMAAIFFLKAVSKKKTRVSGIVISNITLKPLLSNWELKVFSEISHLSNNDIRVFPQVRISDFLKISPGNPIFNKVNCRSVDFLIVDAKSNPTLVIELDDRSHNRPDRRRRDEELDAIYGAIGLAVLHVKPNEKVDWSSVLLPTSANARTPELVGRRP